MLDQQVYHYQPIITHCVFRVLLSLFHILFSDSNKDDVSGPNSLTASRRVSLVSSAYTPVSFDGDAGSRAGSRASLRAPTPNPPRIQEEQSDDNDNRPKSKERNEKPVEKSKPNKTTTMNFGQRDYGHANLQSFMDPAHAHGKMDGAPENPHVQQQNAKENPVGSLKEPRNPGKNDNHSIKNGSNGSTPVVDKRLVDRTPSPMKLIQHDKPVFIPQPRVQTEDRSTNTNQVPHSMACTLL